MSFSPRAPGRPPFALLFAFLAALSVPSAGKLPGPGAPAAPPAPAPVKVDTSPWLFKGSDIPPDPNWHFGRLPNGLRYAVRRNGVPPGQVAVRVRIDAGSLYETDDQQGYAHLIEHLSFRGSKYVPDGDTKRVWQRFGATFGSDSNASTTPTQTVYKLDLPSATETTLGESLKIFAGMMAEPTITAANLAAERPAVLAEQREAPGPAIRYGDAIRALFFAGQPLARRSPIGTIKMLEAATPQTVQAFHDLWYRPERTVVILSGDIGPDVAARLIVQNFAAWKGVGPNPADPDFGKPSPDEPTTAAVVEPSMPAVVAMAVLRPWKYQDDTIEFNQRRLTDFIATRLINRRLETRARAGGSYLQASLDLEDVARSANGTFVNIQPVGDNWDAALRDVRAVIADAMARPPSQAEVDRELTEFDSAMKNDVDTSLVEAGAKQADDMVQALDIRETVAGPAESYRIFRMAREKGYYTPATLLASTQRLFTGVATRALVNTRLPDPGAPAKLAAALKADVSNITVTRTQQAQVDFSKLPPLGAPGSVIAREPQPGLRLEKVTYSNGVRLLVSPTGGEPGRVYVRVRFGDGYGAMSPDRTSAAAWAGDIALMASGIDSLRQDDLDALTTGRRIGADFDIDNDAFQFGALSSPSDYQDQLRLFAAKLAFPAWDPAPVARARAALLSGYEAFSSSPNGVLTRDLEGLLRAGDKRWVTPSRDAIAKLDPGQFRKFWEPLLKTGPIEVSVFGDIQADEAIDAVARTFGALPPRSTNVPEPATIRFPAHNDRPLLLTHNGPANQAAAVIAWPTGGGSSGIAEGRRLDVLAAVFEDRLFDKLRFAAGASYSSSVASQWPVGLTNGGRIVAIALVAPENTGLFFRLSREIAAELASTPLSVEELKRTIDPLQQKIARTATGSPFWLRQLAGGAYDQKRIDASRNVISDFAGMTPAQLQALAAKYLRPDRDWMLVVVPKKAAR